MNRILQLQRKIIPEGIELLERRFTLLRTIQSEQPIGRRTLAQRSGLTERVVRSETDYLKSRQFIDFVPRGMIMTLSGIDLLEELTAIMHDFLGLEEIAEVLRKSLHFKKVYVISGDSDEQPETLDEMGRKSSELLARMMKQYSVVALTGGNTIKKMVEQFPASRNYPDVTVVPARGGVGRHYDIQANTLVGQLADKIGGNYRLLNLPDMISEAALETMLKEKEVLETIRLIRQADVVVAGIGDAMTMARRRNLTEEETRELRQAGAQGEFFGSYYNQSGQIVKQNLAVGLSLADVRQSREVIVLAGGSAKARAILSVDFNALGATLVTDEGAAREIIELSKDMAINQTTKETL